MKALEDLLTKARAGGYAAPAAKDPATRTGPGRSHNREPLKRCPRLVELSTFAFQISANTTGVASKPCGQALSTQ